MGASGALSRLEAGPPLNPPWGRVVGSPGLKWGGQVRSRLNEPLSPLWVRFQCLERGGSSEGVSQQGPSSGSE